MLGPPACCRTAGRGAGIGRFSLRSSQKCHELGQGIAPSQREDIDMQHLASKKVVLFAFFPVFPNKRCDRIDPFI